MSELPSFDPGFTTPALTAVFSAEARVRRMLEVEGALALAQAETGVIPAEHAERIGEACRHLQVDAASVLVDGWNAGSPVIPLLARLRTALPSAAASHVHHGATSQDIVDTATVLQIRDALDEIGRILRSTLLALRSPALEHRDTPFLARTFLQPAGPTTFGVMVAGWAEPLTRHLTAAARTGATLPVQLGGPVGDLATIGHPDVSAAMARRLGLTSPTVPWHTDRTHVAAAVAVAEAIAAGVAKIGADVALLTQTGELAVPSGGSSSMPHKRNPIGAIRAVAAAEACHGAASVVTGARPHELQRGVGGWHAEWWAVPMVFQTAGAAAAAIEGTVAGMRVDARCMAERLAETGLGSPTAGSDLVDRVVAAIDEATA